MTAQDSQMMQIRDALSMIQRRLRQGDDISLIDGDVGDLRLKVLAWAVRETDALVHPEPATPAPHLIEPDTTYLRMWAVEQAIAGGASGVFTVKSDANQYIAYVTGEPA